MYTRTPIIVPTTRQEFIGVILGQPVFSLEHWDKAEKRFWLCHEGELLAALDVGECLLCPDTDRRTKLYFPAARWVGGEWNHCILNLPETPSLPIVALLDKGERPAVKITRKDHDSGTLRVESIKLGSGAKIPRNVVDVIGVLRAMWGINGLVQAKQRKDANAKAKLETAPEVDPERKGRNTYGERGTESERK